jgi:hypothetical protein
MTGASGQNDPGHVLATSEPRQVFVDNTALVTAIIGAGWGAMVMRDLMLGRRWYAAGRAGMSGASLLQITTIGNRSLLEHQVVFAIGIAVIIASMIAFEVARREKQRDVRGLLR